MARFAFRLATLERLRESVRAACRQELAKALRAEETLEREQRRVAHEAEALRAATRKAAGPGLVDVDCLLEAQRFVAVLEAQRLALEEKRRLVQAEIQRRRQALVEANREVQVLQRLRERQEIRFRDEENRRDILRLDETAQSKIARQEAE